MLRLCLLFVVVFSGTATAQTPELPADLTFLLPDDENTAATAGSPAPFWTAATTTNALWRKREGYGLDALGNAWIFEKDGAGDGVGDAVPLTTRISGLTPGREYGVLVGFLSVPSENWRVRAGLAPDSLTEFRPGSPAGRVISLGLSSVAGSNRHQYLGLVGNATADQAGSIEVFIDDGEGEGGASRTWYAGLAYGGPLVIPEPPPLPGGAVEIAPDGAWTWFNDERAIFHEGFLFAGYVRSDGHVGVTRHHPETGESLHVQLSTGASRETDDHNNPSLTVLPDGRLLAIYSRHSTGSEFYHRTSNVPTPAGAADWGPEQIKAMPASNTYANTYRLAAEGDRIFNFSRSINWNPTLTLSGDNGVTWGAPVHFISNGSGSTRPYPRYISNHDDRIDLIYTDGHPRNFHNSIYHLYYRDGAFRKTDGTPVKALAGLPIAHHTGERGSPIYQYSEAAWEPGEGPDQWIPNARAWTWDIHYGSDGHPVCVFQVQPHRPGDFSRPTTDWPNQRIFYYYARWTGTEWQKRFIAQAGRGLYSSEPDYGGGMAIDPEDPRVVYISTNALHPIDLSTIEVGEIPLNPGDRYEIWRGFTADRGLTFSWTPVTENSAADNLRPIVPEGHKRRHALIWFHGIYTSYTSYNTRVLGSFGEKTLSYADWAEQHGLAADSWYDDEDSDGISNLIEYATGGDPKSPAGPSPTGISANAFEFRLADNCADTEWVVESSTDLQEWRQAAIVRHGGLPFETASGFSLAVPQDAPEKRVLTITGEAADRAFFRLAVRLRP